MMVVGSIPISVHGVGSCLSDLDCLHHPFGSPKQCLSLVGNFTPSKSVVLFPFVAWSVMAQLYTSVNESFFLELVYFFSSSVLTSLLCPSSLTPYLLAVSSVRHMDNPYIGTWYTTTTFYCVMCLSLGCTSIIFSITWGFINVTIPWLWKTQLSPSETPLT